LNLFEMRSLANIMTTADLKNIQKVVSDNRLVSDRVRKLREMGYTVKECPMGFGKLLQVREMKRERHVYR